MEVKSQAKYVRVSPRKARVVVDLVRGKSVEQAREILAFTNRAIAETVEKVLNSAVANAEHNNNLNPHQQAHEPYNHHRCTSRGGLAWVRR